MFSPFSSADTVAHSKSSANKNNTNRFIPYFLLSAAFTCIMDHPVQVVKGWKKCYIAVRR